MEAFENYVPGHVEIVVDAIFGVGLSREVGGEFAEAIRFMREQEPKAVVAVDIPSGVSSETGAALGEAVEADLTVTFGYEKLGNGVLSGTEAVRRDCGLPTSGFRRIQNMKGIPILPMIRRIGVRSRNGGQTPTRERMEKILIAAGSEGMRRSVFERSGCVPDGRGTCEDPDRPGKCADSAKISFRRRF